MAKKQSLALNPTKISGQCGRLMCCIQYEYACYAEADEKEAETIDENGDTVDTADDLSENGTGGD